MAQITKGELKKMIQEEIARAQKIKTLRENIAKQTKLLKEMEEEGMEKEQMNEFAGADMLGPEAIQSMGDTAVALTFLLPFVGTTLYTWYQTNKAKADAKLKDLGKKVKGGDVKGASMEAKSLGDEIKKEKPAEGGEKAPMNEMAGPEVIQQMGDAAVALTFALPFVGAGIYTWIKTHQANAAAKLKELGKKVKAGDVKGASAEAKALGDEIKKEKSASTEAK